MRMPNYRLREKVTFGNGWGQPIELPAGSFVRPISTKYVPKHITEDPLKKINEAMETYCYTAGGIWPIRDELLEEC
jgi:hypothetical protein